VISKPEAELLDAIACALDDARPGPCITASSWGLSSFPVDVREVPATGREHSPPVGKPLRPAALCVFCCVERAMAGSRETPRINGDVMLQPCARHAEPAPKLNPNAGVAPAYPKGR